MTVTITVDGKSYDVSIKEAKEIIRQIHEQLYPATKDDE